MQPSKTRITRGAVTCFNPHPEASPDATATGIAEHRDEAVSILIRRLVRMQQSHNRIKTMIKKFQSSSGG